MGGGCPQPIHRRRPGWWEGGGGGRRRAAAAGGGRRRKSRFTNSKSRLGRPGGRRKEEGVWGAGAPKPFIDAGLGGGRAAVAGGGQGQGPSTSSPSAVQAWLSFVWVQVCLGPPLPPPSRFASGRDWFSGVGTRPQHHNLGHRPGLMCLAPPLHPQALDTIL